MTRLLFALSILVASCGHAADGSTPESPERGGAAGSGASRTCVPDGLENAREVEPFFPPQGCGFSAGGSTAAPLVVHDATELAAAMSCSNAPMPSFDFTSNDLYLVRYTMSPATTGLGARDDGATLSFYSRFRQPCPDDPMPMPMSSTAAFSMPKNATRTYRDTNCTLPLDCH